MAGKIIGSKEEISRLIAASAYAVLSLSDGGEPYAVPLNAAWDGEYFYLHSRHSGRKIDILRKNPRVHLTFVPEAAFVQRHMRTSCGGSMDFRSVCVSGEAEIMGEGASLDERRAALGLIAAHFGIDHLPMDDAVIAKTTVIRVKSIQISGMEKPGTPG